MGNVHVPANGRGTAGGCVGRVVSKKVGSGRNTPQPGGEEFRGSAEEVDSLSSGSLKAATANDCGARYIRHEEWLADVCGVSRRRLTISSEDDIGLRGKRLTHPSLSISEDDETPSREAVQNWSQSFDNLMKSAAGRRVFCDFLKSEYSDENLLFWLACEDLREEQNSERVKVKARQIYEDYISILSPKEVSLDGRVREIISKNMANPTNHAFDDAQLQIYTLMQRDSYPRFLNSKMFANLLEQ